MDREVVIVNYGLGNLGSIQNMYKKLGITSQIGVEAGQIEAADKLILPGVGSFDKGMTGLRQSGLLKVLEHKVLEQKTPILGICLGMQLLTKESEEGVEKGLSWIDATTRRFSFPAESGLKIPHMGWNEATPQKQDKLIKDLEKLDAAARFYFVHSYYVECASAQDVLLKSNYGAEFDAAFRHEHIMGVQFHPEKSHKFGMQVLKNFSEI